MKHSEVLAQNLNVLYTVTQNYIKNESSSKIKQALKQTRTYIDIIDSKGDVEYYKRKDNLIGRDVQQILVKHGSDYIRVHAYKLHLRSNNITTTDLSASDSEEGPIQVTQSTEPNKPDSKQISEQNVQNVKVSFDFENNNNTATNH